MPHLAHRYNSTDTRADSAADTRVTMDGVGKRLLSSLMEWQKTAPRVGGTFSTLIYKKRTSRFKEWKLPHGTEMVVEEEIPQNVDEQLVGSTVWMIFDGVDGGCWHGRISRLHATSKYNVEIKFSDGVFPAMLTMENYANNYISRVHSHVADIQKEEVQAATFMECPGVWGLVV